MATKTVTIEGEAAEQLAELAALSGRSEDWFANFMICEYAEREKRIVRDLKEGLESARAGNVVSHEEVMAEIDALLENAGAAADRKIGRIATR